MKTFNYPNEKQKDPLNSDNLENIPVDLQFEILLHKKTIGKNTSQKSSIRKYYRDIYKKKGKIPEGLLYRDARKLSGKKPTISKEIEKQFIELVKNSASDDINEPLFITKNLRTVVNYHRRLEENLGQIPIGALYRLVSKHNLKRYIEKQDYNDEKIGEILECFDSIDVFEKIQVDGCVFKYMEIKDENGKWARPCAIEFLDTGSRYMLSLEIYFKENIENSISAFGNFLRSTRFPQKEIQFRPDRSNAFLNLKRPLKELNLKYSLPNKFYFVSDFAKSRRPKQKAHLESSHRRLHGFEDFIMANIQERLCERLPGVKIKNQSGKIETVTISRFDISISELRRTGLTNRYVEEHNKKFRTFSVAGKQQKWAPNQKFESYISNVETFKFDEADIEDCLKYGFKKEKATVGADGKIRFKNQDYQVVEGNFYGGTKRIKVKVSHYNDKLYIFESASNGVYIGEAIPIGEIVKPERKEKTERRLKRNKFEQLITYLEQHGIVIGIEQMKKLTYLYNQQGLNIDLAVQIINTHTETYEYYIKNDKINSQIKGTLLFNLFIAHYTEYKKIKEIKEIK